MREGPLVERQSIQHDLRPRGRDGEVDRPPIEKARVPRHRIVDLLVTVGATKPRPASPTRPRRHDGELDHAPSARPLGVVVEQSNRCRADRHDANNVAFHRRSKQHHRAASPFIVRPAPSSSYVTIDLRAGSCRPAFDLRSLLRFIVHMRPPPGNITFAPFTSNSAARRLAVLAEGVTADERPQPPLASPGLGGVAVLVAERVRRSGRIQSRRRGRMSLRSGRSKGPAGDGTSP